MSASPLSFKGFPRIQRFSCSLCPSLPALIAISLLSKIYSVHLFVFLFLSFCFVFICLFFPLSRNLPHITRSELEKSYPNLLCPISVMSLEFTEEGSGIHILRFLVDGSELTLPGDVTKVSDTRAQNCSG